MRNVFAFTLIELMVTMAVFGILISVGVPSFITYTRSNQIVTETNALIGTLSFARSEAIKRRTTISICQSSTGNTCANNGDWSQGWIIFVNDDNDAPAQVDGGEEVLRIYGALSNTNSVQANANYANFITFLPNGFSQVQGALIMCSESDASTARSIAVSRTGRVTLSKGGGTCTPA